MIDCIIHNDSKNTMHTCMKLTTRILIIMSPDRFIVIDDSGLPVLVSVSDFMIPKIILNNNNVKIGIGTAVSLLVTDGGTDELIVVDVSSDLGNNSSENIFTVKILKIYLPMQQILYLGMEKIIHIPQGINELL